MSKITINPVNVSRKGVVSGDISESLSKLPKNGKIKKEEGIDELLECLNPATFDFGCIANNIDFLLNSFLNTIYLKCALGNSSVDPGDPSRHVSSGSCNSWFGLPGIGLPQQCDRVDPAKTVAACKTKCTSEGYTFEAAGCDGMTAWCWCQE